MSHVVPDTHAWNMACMLGTWLARMLCMLCSDLQPAHAAGELFTGLSFEGQSSPSAAGVLPADGGDMPATSGDMPATSGDMFSGLTFAEPEPEQPAGPAAVPAVPSSPVAGWVHSCFCWHGCNQACIACLGCAPTSLFSLDLFSLFC